MHRIPVTVGGLPHPNAVVNVVRTAADVAELGTWMTARRGEVLGIDCETNGEDPWDRGFVLRLVQIADMYVSWDVVVNPHTQWALSALIRVHPRFVAHFAENDIRFLMRGLPGSPVRIDDIVPHIVDTQPILASYDPRTVTTSSKKDRIHPSIPRLKGLKDTATRLLTPVLEHVEQAMHTRFKELAPKGFRVGQKNIKWGFANIPDDDPLYLVYSGLDPLVTVRLYWLMRTALEAKGKWSYVESNLDQQWWNDIATYHGMAVDPPYVLWLAAELDRAVAEHAAELAQFGIGESGMGPAVGRAMAALGQECPVVKVNRDTGEKRESWDKVALDKVIESDGPGARLATMIKIVRRAGKFRSTYLQPMIDCLSRDGRLHCSLRAVGTITSRESAYRPPLHQLPKRDTRVRATITAAPGCVLITADFRQGEPFTMAALSGDPVYLADLLAGDINSTIATMVYGTTYDPSQGKAAGTDHYAMRQACKFAWLAWCYGAQPAKVAALLGIDESRGAEIVGRWVSRYPQLAQCRDTLNAQTIIHLDSGWEIPLWDRAQVDERTGEIWWSSRPSRLGLNAATQGTQGDLLMLAKRRIVVAGWLWALRFSLHDELMLEVPEYLAEAARAALEAAMTITYRGVTVRCEASIEGRTWMAQPDSFDPTLVLTATED